MKKSDILVMPGYYAKYLPLVEQEEIIEALYASLDAIKKMDISAIKRVGQNVYAPGKWTVHQILQHIIDTERVFAYRALSFARGDAAALAGMDENAYSNNSHASERSIDDLISELIVVRNSTISLFKSFSDEMLLKTGIANNTENSVLAIGFFVIGHGNHHLNVMRERYFNLDAGSLA